MWLSVSVYISTFLFYALSPNSKAYFLSSRPRGRIQGGGDINTALGLLPDKLKTELALHVNLLTLKKVKFESLLPREQAVQAANVCFSISFYLCVSCCICLSLSFFLLYVCSYTSLRMYLCWYACLLFIYSVSVRLYVYHSIFLSTYLSTYFSKLI